MKLFRRNQGGSQGPVIPEEIQEYYQAEQRERVGVAWLLAVVTFAVVVVGVLGLFFVGKWAYHAVKKDNNKLATTTSQNQPSDNSSNSASNGNGGSQSPTTPAPANTNTTPPAPATNNTTVPSTSTTSPAPSVSGSKQLTNTGPGDVVEIFATTSVAGTAAYSLYTSRKKR